MTVTSSTKLTKYAFGENIKRGKKIYGIYPPHQMIRFGPSRGHIAINPNIDVTIPRSGLLRCHR